MADVTANVLCGHSKTFNGTDLSAKLKLMGVDVASFGDPFADQHVANPARPMTMDDPFAGVYKSCFSRPMQRVWSVGSLSVILRNMDRFWHGSKARNHCQCRQRSCFSVRNLSAAQERRRSSGSMPRVCSCNNVTRAALCDAIRSNDLTTMDEVKRCTKAGTGCGGCVPLLTDILKAELKVAGKKVNNSLCEHFAHTRQELFQICQVKEIKTFQRRSSPTMDKDKAAKSANRSSPRSWPVCGMKIFSNMQRCKIRTIVSWRTFNAAVCIPLCKRSSRRRNHAG